MTISKILVHPPRMYQNPTDTALVGAPKSPTGADIGHGGKDVGKHANQTPAANSNSLTRKGKPGITITLPEAVDLLKSALWYYQKAGGSLRAGNSVHDDTPCAILVLPGCQVCQKCKQPYLFEDIANGMCPACQKEGKP